MRNLKRESAFTLAEVLITLSIIGIVATLTIPTITADSQKQAEVAAYKKAYSEIAQAVKLMAYDNDCTDNFNQCKSLFPYNGDYNPIGNAFKKYFKLAKDCGTTPYDKNNANTICMTDSYSSTYDGSGGRSDLNSDTDGYYRFITADGFSISISDFGCDMNWIGNKPNYNLNKVCASIYVDINGFKGPNNFGRDIFSLYITNGRGPNIYPSGGSEGIGPNPSENYAWVDKTGKPFACTSTNPSGYECAGRIIEQGWQMKY